MRELKNQLNYQSYKCPVEKKVASLLQQLANWHSLFGQSQKKGTLIEVLYLGQRIKE